MRSRRTVLVALLTLLAATAGAAGSAPATGTPPHGAGGAAAATAAAPQPRTPRYAGRILQISRPGDKRLFTHGAVVVRAHALPGTHAVRAFVDGRAIRLDRSSGSFRARVPVRTLRPGAHRLLITSRRHGRRDQDALTFYVGRRDRTLLGVTAPSRAKSDGSAVPLSVRLRTDVQRLTVQLNGHVASAGLRPDWGLRRTTTLSVADGLHYGRNRIVVRAVTQHGGYDVEHRTVVVPRTHPLAEAGARRRGTEGHAIRLDGRAATAMHRGDRLRYRWRIVGAPRGSRATLSGAMSPRPTLHPDVRGTYTLRARVDELRGNRSLATGSDLATVAAGADMPAVGWPLDTLAPNGAGTAMTIATNAYPAVSSEQLQLVALDRATLGNPGDGSVVNESYDVSTPSGVGQLAKEINSFDNNTLIFLAGGDSVSTSTLPNVNRALTAIGVPNLAAVPGDAFSAFGVPGAAAGSMFLNPYGALTGYMTNSFTFPTTSPSGKKIKPTPGTALPSATPGYTFVYGNYQSFSLSSTATSATVTLGSTTQTADLGDDVAGIAATAVNAQSLEVTAPLSVYDVNDADTLTAQSAQQALAAMISTQAGANNLIAVQTIGSVTAATETTSWNAIVAALGQVGATQHLVNTIDGGYSFLGGPGLSAAPAETSTYQSGFATAQEQGVLAPGNTTSSYQPAVSDPLQSGQGYDYSLMPVTYQAPQSWPNADDPSYTAAYQWIESQAKYGMPGGDFRTNYVQNTSLSWSDIYTDLQTKVYPHCPTENSEFSQAVCRAEVEELENEVNWLQDVVAFINNLETPINWVQGAASADIGSAVDTVSQTVTNHGGVSFSTSDVIGDLTAVVGAGFDIASFLTAETTAPVIGAVGAILGVVSTMVTNTDGSSTTSTQQYAISDLSTVLENGYVEDLYGFDQIEDILLSDYGKLSTAGQGIAGDDPGWDWNNTVQDEAVNVLMQSATQWAYSQLMPAAFPAWIVPLINPDMTPVTPVYPGSYWCYVTNGDDYFSLFSGTDNNPYSWFLADQSPTAVMWVLGKNQSTILSESKPFQILPSATAQAMNDIFEGNLLLQAKFWAQSFDPQQLTAAKYALADCQKPKK